MDELDIVKSEVDEDFNSSEDSVKDQEEALESVYKGHRKIWTKREVDKILDYIIVHKNLERPTMRVYYTKLIADTKIDATWVSVKEKMRHLRNSFRKAGDYSRLSNDSPDEIKLNILRICPNYEKLNSIFGEENKYDEDEDEDSQERTDAVASKSRSQSDERSKDPLGGAEVQWKKTNSRSAIELLTGLQTERNSLFQQKMKMQRERFMQEIEVEEKKLRLQERQLELDFQIQEKRLELEEEKLKIEQEQKIREYELRKLEIERKRSDQLYEG